MSKSYPADFQPQFATALQRMVRQIQTALRGATALLPPGAKKTGKDFAEHLEDVVQIPNASKKGYERLMDILISRELAEEARVEAEKILSRK